MKILCSILKSAYDMCLTLQNMATPETTPSKMYSPAHRWISPNTSSDGRLNTSRISPKKTAKSGKMLPLIMAPTAPMMMSHHSFAFSLKDEESSMISGIVEGWSVTIMQLYHCGGGTCHVTFVCHHILFQPPLLWPYAHMGCKFFTSLLCNSCNFQYFILGWPTLVLGPSIKHLS